MLMLLPVLYDWFSGLYALSIDLGLQYFLVPFTWAPITYFPVLFHLDINTMVSCPCHLGSNNTIFPVPFTWALITQYFPVPFTWALVLYLPFSFVQYVCPLTKLYETFRGNLCWHYSLTGYSLLQ